uniref:Arrestin C-terminal-like domain-containing protein n=1 Tax=Panagrolaimus davidi TaxID=227884 RepID=A0A914PUY3_9BILA
MAKIPYRIFNLNDEIPLSVEISNFSVFPVESIETGLCWNSNFSGKPHSNDGPAIVDTIKGELDYSNTQFSIPAGTASTFEHTLKSTATLPTVNSCSILKHNYLVFVRIHFGDSTKVLKFLIPIILSNIAFHETVEGGETMLPSESVEAGVFPKVTVPQSQIEQKEQKTETEKNSAVAIPFDENLTHSEGIVHAPPESLHV